MLAGEGEMKHDALAMIEYGDNPALLVFGDSEAARDRARRSAGFAGCRVAAEDPVADAVGRLDRHAVGDPVLLELAGPEECEGLVLLLDRLRAEAEGSGRRAVIVAPPALMPDGAGVVATGPEVAAPRLPSQ